MKGTNPRGVLVSRAPGGQRVLACEEGLGRRWATGPEGIPGPKPAEPPLLLWTHGPPHQVSSRPAATFLLTPEGLAVPSSRPAPDLASRVRMGARVGARAEPPDLGPPAGPPHPGALSGHLCPHMDTGGPVSNLLLDSLREPMHFIPFQ